MQSVDWRKLLPFVKVFEQPSFRVGEWITEQNSFPFYSLSEEVSRFIKTAYEAGVVENFNWPDWQAEAERLFLDPKQLEAADLSVLRKLLTTHIRKDRFSDGHLAAMFEAGHILAILRRVEALTGR